MTHIGNFKPTRSMSHHQLRQYTIFNHPRAAQREVAIMRALKDGPLYTSAIRHRAKLKDRPMRRSLVDLERAGMIERTSARCNWNFWKLV